MVDFKKIRIRTPEEQKEAAEKEAAKKAKEKKLLKRAEAIEQGLSDWEMGFIDSVSIQHEFKGYLSEKQWSIVNRILEEKG